MKIVYWSDYACPYCYIAEARLHKAIAELGLTGDVSFEPKAFELDPGAPIKPVSDTASRFAMKYRLPLEEAMAQIEHISSLGRAEGLEFKYATTRYTNTFNAHRLMKLALSKNDPQLAEKTNTLLFAAYFTKNLELAADATLLEAGVMAGLKEEEISALLKGDAFGDQVRADEREASTRGIHGVPYFVFENGFVVPGAISTDDFRKILTANQKLSNISSHQCGPSGCVL